MDGYEEGTVSGPAAAFPLTGLWVGGAALRVTTRGGPGRGMCV